jgi:hypothetical protein
VPAPTPNWRDLAAGQATGPAPATVTAPTAAPAAPPAPGFTAPQGTLPAPDPAAGDPAAWEQAAQHGATPLTPQATAPAPAPADPADASAELGMRLAGAGAAATDVDAAALLQQLRALQRQVDQLTAQQTAAQAPDVVKYAVAFADHLQAKADAHPVINADPDHTFIPALHKAAQMVNGAEQVAAGGTGHEGLVTLARDAGKWVELHARRFKGIDYDYLLQLAAEVASAAAKLAA